MSIVRNATIAMAVSCALGALAPKPAQADEGGVSFWIPGFFGSLAAAPQQPGWSLTTMYYHTSVDAGADVAFARQVNRGRLTVPFTGNVNANLDARADLAIVIPQYVFATPIFGGQAAVLMLVPIGRNRVSVDATLTASLGPFGFDVSGGRTDSVGGFADLVPFGSLRWNHGTDNWIVYVTSNLPIGAYDPNRLANLGIGHWAVDSGGGYTYFNPQTGHEFSAVLGFTYNFKNPDTQYQNGIDMHLDWGASQFLTKEWQIGLVGYVYQQLTCDSGSGDRVGCFRSRVLGIGPQVGHIFKVSDDYQGYVNVKGYKEFAGEHRPEGWNVWLTRGSSPAAPETPTPTTRRIAK